MNRLKLFLPGVLLAAVVFGSCKKENSDNNGNPNNNKLPDTYFKLEVTGDRTDSFEITIPSGTPQTDFAIIGAFVKVSNLGSLQFRQVPMGWGMGLSFTANTVRTGTFQDNQSGIDISGYNSNTEGWGYLSTGMTVNLTKADKHGGAQGVDVYIVDGNFSGTMEDPNDASKTVNISGSFSGVAVSAQ